MDNPTNQVQVNASEDERLSAVLNSGKRRLMNAFKTTKESSYFRSITSAIQQSFAYDEETASIAAVHVPDDTKIVLYRTYTRFISNEYITEVSGCIYCPGTMNRKNKLMMSLIQRLSKPNVPTSTVSQIESEIEDSLTHPDTKTADTDSASTVSSGSESTASSSVNDTIRDRIQGIMARNIPRTPLNITLYSDDKTDSLLGANLYTDSVGAFNLSVASSYKPSYITVSSLENPAIQETQIANVIDPKGVSVITDIDDTVRTTGVLGDKRELFRNVFARDFNECEIPRLAVWLQQLKSQYHCPIHYVSNSPWQIYNIVCGFMDYVGLPVDSISLRQYSGNLIASFTMPSSERKKDSLIKLFKDFPNRKFILIGDAGEQDIEAYAQLVKLFPTQVLAVYIRALNGAFSSTGEDMKVFKELEAILATRDRHVEPKTEKKKKKFTPIPPPKPKNLQGEALKLSDPPKDHKSYRDSLRSPILHREFIRTQISNTLSHSSDYIPLDPPPLPRRGSLHRSLPSPPPVPRRPAESPRYAPLSPTKTFSFSQHPESPSEDYSFDKKKELWKERVQAVVSEYPPEVDFRFWWDPSDVMNESFEAVQRAQ
ncbi:hypothetical protein OGAPHI_001137 [Ogataea philodendri]|uniref:Phosphatidate phosphatase APP1 catalytic domain-containing protein n=1 Tax=Ogataea philodendri TaxID=1378263 RepID=A0A9P8PEN1_9ASCO|nr:uncharacterized protein OGAPHI_001137 [Ogataea philodendri]KAH3670622.1 hypothetical protein OGAPHI_001137 [Ogataea philodendri]